MRQRVAITLTHNAISHLGVKQYNCRGDPADTKRNSLVIQNAEVRVYYFMV